MNATAHSESRSKQFHMLPTGMGRGPSNRDSADVLDRLRRCLPQRFRGISPQTPIATLELDSLDLVEFLCAIDAEFNVSFTLEEFESVTTARELAALIHRKINQTPGPYDLR